MTEPVRRVNFFAGQLLTSEDFRVEQDYHRDMRYLRNRILGSGVVSGLDVSVVDDSTVIVGPGLALDPHGREIVLAEEVCIELAAGLEPDAPVDVTATWDEVPDGFVENTAGCSDGRAFSRWLERPRVAHLPPEQVQPESLVLARLIRAKGRITDVDLSVRVLLRRSNDAAD